MDNESEQDEALKFAFEDQEILSELESGVRTLLQRPNLLPKSIADLAHFLFALSNLPASTPDAGVRIELAYKVGRESNWVDITLTEETFRIQAGGRVYDPAVGGDNFSSQIFEASLYHREGDLGQLAGFLASFQERVDDPECILSTEVFNPPFDNWDFELTENDPWDLIE